MKLKKITAVNVAIVDNNKRVLIAKRPPDKAMPNKWEFPGGKLEESETLQECGIREIKEELAVDISIDKYLGFEELVHAQNHFSLHLYTARKVDETQIEILSEHTESKWVDVDDLVDFDFPAFDLPFIQKLKKYIISL